MEYVINILFVLENVNFNRSEKQWDFHDCWQHDPLDNRNFHQGLTTVKTFRSHLAASFSPTVREQQRFRWEQEWPPTTTSGMFVDQQCRQTRARLNIAATKPWNSNEGGLLPTPDEVHNSTGERNSPWYLMVDCSDNGTVDSIGNSCPYLPSTWLVSQQAQWQLWRRGSTTQQSCTSQQPCPTKWFGFLAGRCEPTKAQARGWDPWRMTTARMAASWTQWPTTCFGPTDCYGQRIYHCVW